MVLLHRAGSVMPFTTIFRELLSPHVDMRLMDCLVAATDPCDGSPCLMLRPSDSAGRTSAASATLAVLQDLQRYQQLRERLLAIPFTSIDDYLSLLEGISCAITRQRGISSQARSRVLYFLAAAVSDFYVPPELLPQHKIQSGPLPSPPGHASEQQQQQQRGSTAPLLCLDLHPVPKKMTALVQEWAPGAFVTSFKLETDLELVVSKAQMAIRNYSVHLVVANQLQVLLLHHHMLLSSLISFIE